METVTLEIGDLIKNKVEVCMFMHKPMKSMMVNGIMDLDMVMVLLLINAVFMRENFKITLKREKEF